MPNPRGARPSCLCGRCPACWKRNRSRRYYEAHKSAVIERNTAHQRESRANDRATRRVEPTDAELDQQAARWLQERGYHA